MIQKCAMIFAAFTAMYSCQSRKTELASTMPVKNETDKFQEYQATVIAKEDNIRMNAQRYALSSLPQLESLVLTHVYIPIPGTSGEFYMLPVNRGEQYNLELPGGGQAYVNAATLLFINFSAGEKNFIIQGKAWLKTEREPAIIKADDFTIALWPQSKINIDNYPDDSNIIISLMQGNANVTRYGETIRLPAKDEIWLEKATGKIKIKQSPVDVTSWTIGAFRHSGLDFTHAMREIGRLYNKDIYFDKINVTAYPYNYEFRRGSIEQVVELYNSNLPSIKIELNRDSIKVLKR